MQSRVKYSERELNRAANECLMAPVLFDQQYPKVGELVKYLIQRYPAIKGLQARHFDKRG